MTTSSEPADDGYSDVRAAIWATREEWDAMDYRTQELYRWLIRSKPPAPPG